MNLKQIKLIANIIALITFAIGMGVIFLTNMSQDSLSVYLSIGMGCLAVSSFIDVREKKYLNQGVKSDLLLSIGFLLVTLVNLLVFIKNTL